MNHDDGSGDAPDPLVWSADDAVRDGSLLVLPLSPLEM